MKDTAVYIHIPFCDHKCIYCDFYSIINYKDKNNYLSALLKEIEYYGSLYPEGRMVSSLYFGGGTPSFMPPEYINEIIYRIRKYFAVSDTAEITLETNPGTVDKHKLNEFRNIGINRISIGIQSFIDDELKFLTRIHDGNTAIDTVNQAASSGFENISVDLIFNLPGQTKFKWQTNLDTALNLPITHISPYSLILERGTILNKMVLDGKVVLNEEDHDADLYECTMNYLNDRGFAQYEVSNFAKPDFECRHNLAYWSHLDYLGFGTSAHSFVDGVRRWNYSGLTFYINSIREKGNAEAGKEILTEEQKFEEYIMLSLRSKGLNKHKLLELFGEGFFVKNKSILTSLLNGEYIIDTGNFIKFTPRGYSICDEILSRLEY